MKDYTFQCHVIYKPESGLKGQWLEKKATAIDRVQARLMINKQLMKNKHIEKVEYKFMY